MCCSAMHHEPPYLQELASSRQGEKTATQELTEVRKEVRVSVVDAM